MSSRSRSPEDYQSRSRGRSQDSRPRSKTGSLSPRRSPSRDSRSPAPRRNGRYRDSRSRSLTRSRSRSRDDRVRSPSRGRSRSRSESPLRSTKIVVERLTKNVTEEHLREIFGAYGTIHDMDVPLSRQFGTNRGAAYILYANESDAESAIAHMHEAQLDGATISVSIVLQRRKLSPPPPTANRGANFDPRLPPPGRGPRGPSGGGMAQVATVLKATVVTVVPEVTRGTAEATAEKDVKGVVLDTGYQVWVSRPRLIIALNRDRDLEAKFAAHPVRIRKALSSLTVYEQREASRYSKT
ncbi:hypothetical protein VM1G_10106 [Cytospora mali]|uniref:RRM domain-containing protein n=1 Tax=Cytospora mali TaxID=578113 RepID=A0A194WE91_CYTMA|nr:hypothetical protein VM1G_10106 [Valsa mali]